MLPSAHPESAANVGPSSTGPCSTGPCSNEPDSNGHAGSNGPVSLDSLPSVQRVGESALLNERSQMSDSLMSKSVLLTKSKSKEVNLKRSLTLVE